MNLSHRGTAPPAVVHDNVYDVPVVVRDPFEAGMSMTQMSSILRAHWKASLAIAFSVVALTAVTTKLMTKTYVSVATLSVNFEARDPLAGKEVSEEKKSSFVATQIELMQSPEVLDRVVEGLDLGADQKFSAGNRGGENTLRDWVALKLQQKLDIEQGHGGSDLIRISASAYEPVLAAKIANAVAKAYMELEYRRTSGPASERAKRYTDELADLKAKAVAAQESLTQFRLDTGAVNLDPKSDVDMALLDSLSHRLLDVRNAQRASLARAAGSPDVSTPVMESPTVRTLRSEGAALSARMARLRIELGPNNPQVVELSSQIEANAKSVADAVATYSKARTSDLSVSSSEAASLEKAVEAQRVKVIEQQKLRDQSSKYQLELEAAQAVYKRALDGYDQIVFASSGRNTSISLMAPARPPIRATRPDPMLNMALGTLLGVLLGFGGTFLYELARRRVRCRDDMERVFGVRVLTEFAAIRSMPRSA